MNAFVRRDKILDELRRESNGSFVTLHRALVEASKALSAYSKREVILNVSDVKNRIRAIRTDTAQKQPNGTDSNVNETGAESGR